MGYFAGQQNYLSRLKLRHDGLPKMTRGFYGLVCPDMINYYITQVELPSN